MIADLLQAGEQCQHLAVPFAAGGLGNGIEGVFDGLGIERFLFLAQSHPFAQLHLLRQIRDDRFVGLQSAQDEGADSGFEIPQR